MENTVFSGVADSGLPRHKASCIEQQSSMKSSWLVGCKPSSSKVIQVVCDPTSKVSKESPSDWDLGILRMIWADLRGSDDDFPSKNSIWRTLVLIDSL